jgi:pantoate--beta-alanine ligase
MILLKEAAVLEKFITSEKRHHKTIGYVPTMGALHDGHLSLVSLSKSKADITICSIFINPTQFNDPKDFEKYPVTVGNDILLLEKGGCDILFYPSLEEIYPLGTELLLKYDIGRLETILEAKYRPGHFQGVCQVVHRFLNIVKPDYLILGQKDYQQCLVIKQLIKNLKLPVELITATTTRELSGLAMSSRNLRLSEEEKEIAAGIFEVLNHIKQHYCATDVEALEKYGIEYLLKLGFTKVDYVSIADADTLEDVISHNISKRVLALIAAYIGEVRLIDNMIITE